MAKLSLSLEICSTGLTTFVYIFPPNVTFTHHFGVDSLRKQVLVYFSLVNRFFFYGRFRSRKLDVERRLPGAAFIHHHVAPAVFPARDEDDLTDLMRREQPVHNDSAELNSFATTGISSP